MLRRAGRTFQPHFRRLHSHTASSARNAQNRINANRGLAIAAGATIASVIAYSNIQTVYNDSALETVESKEQGKKPTWSSVISPDELQTLVWGSNSNGTLYPQDSSQEPLRVPSVADWLNNVALRDLVFHQKYGACIDAKGDVYQWGSGFFEGDSRRLPKLTLRGKNIVQLQTTEKKLYALSASGRVYVLATNEDAQKRAAGSPTPSSDLWWSTGWLWGEDEDVDFGELCPREPLGWGEKVVRISAGQNHLLALTSRGRAYAHPVNKKANEFGQLGFRKVDIPEPHAPRASGVHLQVELIPKSMNDPYSKASREARAAPAESSTTDILSKLDDTSIHFCPLLFEIPVLRGVEIAQLVAGGRTSFARTPTGRVLGWGANEFGQIGLGTNVSLDSISVPTEVVLWKMTARETSSTCSDVAAGGDLTSFKVIRTTGPSKSVDVLMCGNGQYGGLGNNTYSNAQSMPTRVKIISGLMEYSDKTDRLEPIIPDEINVSPTGHVLLALNSAANSKGIGGKDLMVWGKNFDSELGNGKRSSAAGPITLQDTQGERLMLMTRKARVVCDLKGKVWKKGVNVEQHIATGYGSSVVYWKIAA